MAKFEEPSRTATDTRGIPSMRYRSSAVRCARAAGSKNPDQGLAQVSKPLQVVGIDEFDDAFEAATYF